MTTTASNQIYIWDITYLATQVKGQFCYLYLFMDIFSRKIVGWQVYQEESSQHAAEGITDLCQPECIRREQLVLHSDNGSPMKGATMLATLQKLGGSDFFVDCYNHEYRHGGIQFVTPTQRHEGKGQAILIQRNAVYEGLQDY